MSQSISYYFSLLFSGLKRGKKPFYCVGAHLCVRPRESPPW
jgi:hypothetical protein